MYITKNILKFSFAVCLLVGHSISLLAEEPAAPTSAMNPWTEAENKVQELSSRINSKKSQIQDLIKEKQAAKEDSMDVRRIVDSLLKEHSELKNLIADYERNLNLLKYRFPERSAKNNRLYKKIEMQSLDEIESDMGIDGKLSRNMQVMRTHYGTTAPSKQRIPASTHSDGQSQKIPEGSIENPAPIVLKK